MLNRTSHKKFSSARKKRTLSQVRATATCSQVQTIATCEKAAEEISQRAKVLNSRTKQAIEICQRFNVSLATAYRHLKRGTTPASERGIGADGRRYPRSRNAKSVSQVMRELNLSRQALNRADRKACDSGICADDLSALHEILRLVQDAVVRWSEVEL